LIPPDPIHAYISLWFRARRRNFTIRRKAGREPVDRNKPLHFLININARNKPAGGPGKAI
jgi:hypothetical protein